MNKTFSKDKLVVQIYDNRVEMGLAAAAAISEKIHAVIAVKGEVNMVFAAAPSQNDVLSALLTAQIDWSKVNAFHMDEYVGLAADAPQSFGNFLRKRIFDKVSFKSVNLINGSAHDLKEECERYENLLRENPLDMVCLGIGENAHIAFNDPHVADFDDPTWVKIVDLDFSCRQQQVNDGCFQEIGEVPKYALTLTVPALLGAKFAYCVVPDKKKAQAVRHTLYSEITEKYPSTILRTHPDCVLFLDSDSANMLN